METHRRRSRRDVADVPADGRLESGGGELGLFCVYEGFSGAPTDRDDNIHPAAV